MTRLVKICLLVIAVQLCDVANSTPIFEGINIERKINIGFKPFKFKPFTFIKERWGPLGRFGKKHVIEKRQAIESNIIERGEFITPLFEPAGEKIIPVVEKLQEPVKVIPPLLFRPAVPEPPPPKPPVGNGLNTDIAIPSNPYFSTLGAAISPLITPGEALGPVVETKPIEGPLFVPVSVITPKPASSPVPPPPPPPPPVIEPPPRPGLISFFGELLSEIMARFIARARASFSQLGSPPVQQ